MHRIVFLCVLDVCIVVTHSFAFNHCQRISFLEIIPMLTTDNYCNSQEWSLICFGFSGFRPCQLYQKNRQKNLVKTYFCPYMENAATSVILSENTDFYQFILNWAKLILTSLLNAVFHSKSPWLPPTSTLWGPWTYVQVSFQLTGW